MIFVTFNGGVSASLKKMNLNRSDLSDVFMLFFPLEIGNIKNPENSKTNEILYDVVAGKGSYLKFKSIAKQNIDYISKLDKSEKVYFWVDFNDVKQYLNFAYFIDVFEKFEHKFIIEYDFNFYCENPNNINYYFEKNKPISEDFIRAIKLQFLKVQKQEDMIFRAVDNGFLVSVKDDYFDKFIMEFLSEKPKPFMQIISEISSKYGRLAVSFDQVVIRLWMLIREGVVERVGHGSEFGLFFEYKYKLSDHIDMQRDV